MKTSTRLSATSRVISELSSGIREIESKCTVEETQHHEDDVSSTGSSNKRSSVDDVSTSDNASASDNASTSDNASSSENASSTSGECTSTSTERLAKKENVAVKYSKCLVYFVLVLVATGAGYSTFHFLDQEEKKDFEVQVS
jgi:cobalamin biosynthesis Mg chelatase CobN